MQARRRATLLCLLFLSAVFVLTQFSAIARAGDFYLTANMGISGGSGDSSGSTPFFDNTGSDTDSSPVYGGTVGIDVSLRELIGGDVDLDERWAIRHEIEGLAGRDYEFITMGAERYLSDVTSWSVMYNILFDVPIQPALAHWFGRIPVLDPLTVYTGAGLGLGATSIKTSDNVSFGSEDLYDFAWQLTGGLSYALTDRVSLDLGYRYRDMGTAKVALQLGPNPFGDFNLDLVAHELHAGIRVRFWSLDMRGPR